MKRFIGLVAALYPANWRRRYGVEFGALLEDSAPDWYTVLDILRGALIMQIRSWDFKAMAIAGGLGALLAFGGSFGIPPRYVSQALIKVEPPQARTADASIDYVFRLAGDVTRPTKLVTAINTFKLYVGERARHPIEDVIQSMREKIFITLPDHQDTKDGSIVVRVEFVSDDPGTARQIANHLVSQFIEQNMQIAIREGADQQARAMRLIEPASVARNASYPQRVLITGAGLMIGVAIGALLARRRAATYGEPHP